MTKRDLQKFKKVRTKGDYVLIAKQAKVTHSVVKNLFSNRSISFESRTKISKVFPKIFSKRIEQHKLLKQIHKETATAH